MILSLVLTLLLQAPVTPPAPAKTSVIVGLLDGQQLALDNPEWTGFIESRDNGEAVLLYREKQFRGELKLSTIQRVDIAFKKDSPYQLSVTLKNGQKLQVESDRRNFVMVKGSTDSGSILIKHPDPISHVVQLSTKMPNREKDLTIKYLEFPR